MSRERVRTGREEVCLGTARGAVIASGSLEAAFEPTAAESGEATVEDDDEESEACNSDLRSLLTPGVRNCLLVGEPDTDASHSIQFALRIAEHDEMTPAWWWLDLPDSVRARRSVQAFVRRGEVAVDEFVVERRGTRTVMRWTLTNRSSEPRVVCALEESSVRSSWADATTGEHFMGASLHARRRATVQDCEFGVVRVIEPGQRVSWQRVGCDDSLPVGASVTASMVVAVAALGSSESAWLEDVLEARGTVTSVGAVNAARDGVREAVVQSPMWLR